MTDHSGSDRIPPAEQAEGEAETDRRNPPEDANTLPPASLPRNAGSWAAKVDRLTVAGGRSHRSNVASGASPARCRASGRCGRRPTGSR